MTKATDKSKPLADLEKLPYFKLMTKIVVAALYQFKHLHDYKDLQPRLKSSVISIKSRELSFWLKKGLMGRLLVLVQALMPSKIFSICVLTTLSIRNPLQKTCPFAA